jgi:tripartite-type tricarboxylate transporter receptor subunit TctC
VVGRLNAALTNALDTREVRDRFDASAMEAFVTTPDEAGRFIAGEATRFAKLIKARGITSD